MTKRTYLTGDLPTKDRPATLTYLDNSCVGCLRRFSGINITKEITVVGGPGPLVADVLEWTGCVLIKQQYAFITEVTSLVNATDAYATIFDQSVETKLTKGSPGGADLSGSPVGTFFTADEDDTNPYTVLKADQARKKSTTNKDIGLPFFINAKPGVENVIRFRLTTTDAPVSFKMTVTFIYFPMDGGTLEFK